MKTLDLTYFGATVSLPDLARYRKFYRKLVKSAWEPATFAVLAHNLDRNTVYVDIGAWIGVTPLWASHFAKAVIAVEPDPTCLAILRALTRAYPNVRLIEGALAPEASVDIHAVDGFGSSETSALDIGTGGCATVHGLSFRDILAPAGGDRVFIKIDIEGYEYKVMGMFAELQSRRLAGLQVAIHPQLYERSLKSPGLASRLRVAAMTVRLHRRLARLRPGLRIRKYRSLAHYVLAGIVCRKEPKGTDFILTGAA